MIQDRIQEHVSLDKYTTLKVGGPAEYFVMVESEEALVEAVAYAQTNDLALTILGGGSNVLIRDAGVPGLVVHIALKGVKEQVSGDRVLLTAYAGESLDAVVAHTVERGWWGIENFSHIPGSVGAVPVQNVGAYGVEARDVVTHVRVFNCESNSFEILSPEQCQFAYRDSVFKKPEGKHYIVTSVQFALRVSPHPCLSYRDLQERFGGQAVPQIADVRNAVIDIRSHKFPDWHRVGTAGSFFKNPIITKEKYEVLLREYPLLPHYPVDAVSVKVPLGWILDKALGMKGAEHGTVGTYRNQALVIVNNGNATATEIESFANEIVAHVKKKFDIVIEWEVTRV